MKALILLFICFPAVLYSQNKELPTIGVRALAMERPNAQPEHYLKTETGYQLLNISHRQPRPPIRALTDGNLNIYEKSVNEENEAVFEVVEALTIPKGAKSILLLGKESSEGFRYHPVNDNFQNANFREWLMINATEKVVYFQIGTNEKPFTLQPNRIQTFEVNAPTDVGAPIHGQADWDGERKTFYSTFWPIHTGQRSIVIFYEDGKKIRVKKITDPLLVRSDANTSSG